MSDPTKPGPTSDDGRATRKQDTLGPFPNVNWLEPPGTPVGWQYRWKHESGWTRWHDTSVPNAWRKQTNTEVRPLYTTPPSLPEGAREALEKVAKGNAREVATKIAARPALAKLIDSGALKWDDLCDLRDDIEKALATPTSSSAGLIEAAKWRTIYLAARYSRAPELKQYRSDLEAMGFVVTSRWIEGGHELTKEGSAQAHETERTRFAQEDKSDLERAECVISFTEEPRKTTTRGGRHVEFGIALARRQHVIVIGHRENVFHCLPEVEFYASWAAFLASLRALPAHRNEAVK